MSTNTTLTQQPRTNKRTRTTPASAGLPDPRPLTDYDVVYEEFAGHSQLLVTLGQPCVIRAPAWSVIDCDSGVSIDPLSVQVISNTTFILKYDGIIPDTVGFVEVPYQDMQVQNFQGGFVRPGGRWFRAPK